jgi:hypothetical protein
MAICSVQWEYLSQSSMSEWCAHLWEAQKSVLDDVLHMGVIDAFFLTDIHEITDQIEIFSDLNIGQKNCLKVT